MVVGEHCDFPSHWRNTKTLDTWMKQENVAGIHGVDTRELTKRIREKGTMLGRIVHALPIPEVISIEDPNKRNLVAEVSIKVTQIITILIIYLYRVIFFDNPSVRIEFSEFVMRGIRQWSIE